MPSRCGVPPLHARARERAGEKENGREELDLSLATQPRRWTPPPQREPWRF
jgi:hypothetical protein